MTVASEAYRSDIVGVPAKFQKAGNEMLGVRSLPGQMRTRRDAEHMG